MFEAERRIGLTMRTVEAVGYTEPRDALAQLWPNFLAHALPEVVWMYLPNLGQDKIVEYCDTWDINGLILTGGEDVGSTSLRDETERALLTWAASNQFPVLGICRGLQLMAVEAGVVLDRIEGHVASRHRLNGVNEREVNSFHSAAFFEAPPGYKVCASATDGSVEAIAHLNLPWEGWMWHPERETPFDANDINEARRIFL